MTINDEPTRESHDAYPPELTDFVLERWPDVEGACGGRLPKPLRSRLEEVLSASYQASLFREEDRPVTFRLALADPGSFEAAAGPPTGLHRLIFSEPRPLNQHELRRLSPAAAFSRSFIGARLDARQPPSIWGLIHSGPNWLQSVRGGRETLQAIPPVPTIAVTGPGRVLVEAGPVVIAEMTNGTLVGDRLDVFNASWMEQVFSEFAAPALAPERAGADGAAPIMSPAFGSTLARQVLRRILAGIRSARHGGMLLIVPAKRVSGLLGENGSIRIKYRFIAEEPRHRLATLSGRIAAELVNTAASGTGPPIGWAEYVLSEAPRIKELDTALFEVANFAADLAQLDGAVVVTDELDVLGFGAEIAGNLPELSRVAHALDLDGHTRAWVRTDRVGTRHRAAYRLCHVAPDVLAVVVSQDGGMQFVRWHGDAVTYWDQVVTGAWDAW
jgi:hypothetical protein